MSDTDQPQDPAPADDALLRRLFPCGPCPIRADNADNPAAKFPAERWDRLECTVREGHNGASPPPFLLRPDGWPELDDNGEPIKTPMFACHKGQPGDPDGQIACAGWLAVFGHDHATIRYAATVGRLPASALRPGEKWPPLHPDWQAVRAAQTWQPGDPDEHLHPDLETDACSRSTG